MNVVVNVKRLSLLTFKEEDLITWMHYNFKLILLKVSDWQTVCLITLIDSTSLLD